MNFFNYCCYHQKRKLGRDAKEENDALDKTIGEKDLGKNTKMTVDSSNSEVDLAYIKLAMFSCNQDIDSAHQEMLDAVVNKDKTNLRRLIECESKRNSWSGIYQFVNNSKRVITPIELACTLGYTEIIYMFLDNGCSPNLPTTTGRLIHTILESLKSSKMSLKEGLKLVQRLCEEGCNVNICGENNKTPILLAAELGDVDILKVLLCVSEPSIQKIGDFPNGFTPLHMTSMRGDLDCVLAILKHCSSTVVNMLDTRFCTPLKLALVSMYKNLTYMNSLTNVDSEQMQKLRQLQYNSVAIVEALLLHGAQVNTETDIGKTLLYQALMLVREDKTCEKFQQEKFSQTMQLVASTKLQELNTTLVGNDTIELPALASASPYAGIVRLFVLFGTNPVGSKEVWLSYGRAWNKSEVVQLIDEMFYFWENNENNGPQKLIQLSKQVIRSQLANNQTLHKVDSLPLPPSLISFIKLQCL